MALTSSKPIVDLVFNKIDISIRFSDYVTSFVFVDHLQDEPDALEVTFEDRQGWIQGPAYPCKGTEVRGSFGYEGAPLLEAPGPFWVDEMELHGPPDVATLRCVSVPTKTRIRDRRSVAWEGMTLKEIAMAIAGEHGLQHDVELGFANLSHKRLTQHEESDLAFLNRLAQQYGLVLCVKAGKLKFRDLDAMEEMDTAWSFKRHDLKTWRFRDKTMEGESGSIASYFNPETKSLVEWDISISPGQEEEAFAKTMGQRSPQPTLSGRGTKILRRHRAEGQLHAERMAKAALHLKKGFECEGTLTLFGNRLLQSGQIVVLDEAEFGAQGGRYQIKDSRHTLNEDGYSTELTIRRLHPPKAAGKPVGEP